MRLQVDTLQSITNQEQSANRALAEEVANQAVLCEASNVELQGLQMELTEANRNLANELVSLAETRRSRDDLQSQFAELEKRLSEQASQHKATLQRERDATQKLSAQLRMSKTAEDTLKGEVEQYVCT
ncbi:hypothetical protein JVU11DRAFT_2645 [Chiua virens]|nr:hypothetical protein JVU11DRAFT_2645 [Chiua virens]